MDQVIYTLEDFFKNDLMVKLADHKLPKEIEKWQQAIIAILHASHPWFKTADMKFDVRKVDKDAGTAVGSLIVEEKLKIPLVIKDFKLKPLDIYMHNGKLRLLSQRSFFQDTLGKSIGSVQKPGKGEQMNQSLWKQVYAPHEGRYSFASLADKKEVEKAVHASFTPDQLKLGAQASPYFKNVIKESMRQYSQEKTASDKPGDKWDIIKLNDLGKGSNNGLNYIHLMDEKVACFLGTKIFDPVLNIIDDGFFGIEANADKPRYFLSNKSAEHSDLAVEGIDNLDEFNLHKNASYNGFEAFLAPIGDFTVLVGPFESKYRDIDGKERISTMTGELDIIENPYATKPMSKAGSVLMVGPGTVRVSLGDSIYPMATREVHSAKTASLTDTSNTVLLAPHRFGPQTVSINHKGLNYYSVDKLMSTLEKEASFSDEVKKEATCMLRKGRNVYLKKTKAKKQYDKLASAHTYFLEVRPEQPAELMRASIFLKPFTKLAVQKVRVFFPELSEKLAGMKEEEIKDTVDSILGLNLITPANIERYLERVGKLEEAQDICANLLLMARLGFPIEEQPVKTALTSLTETIHKLKMVKNTSESTYDSVV